MIAGVPTFRWKIVVPLGVALVLAAGTGAWALTRPSAASDTVTYRSATASIGTIRQAVSATGTIEPKTVDDLSFTSGGQVTAVNVALGQQVTAGQVLATISSAALQSAVASAQATVASAKARLATDQAAGASNAQLDADSANITVAETQLADAQAALAGATLTAPIDGTVTAVNVTVGQQLGNSGQATAGSGSSSGQGSGNTGSGSGNTGAGSGSSGSGATSSSSTAAIQVISTGSYLVNASVDSTDIALVKKGNQVLITPAGASANVFGLVSSVGIVATTTSGVASFPVVVEVTGSPPGLYAGATASLQIVYKQLTDVLVVPALAVNRSGGTSYVLVPDGESRVRRDVVTGVSSGGLTEIVSGLSEGDVVLVAVPTGNTGSTGTGGTGGNGTGNGTTGGGIGNRGGTVPGAGRGGLPGGSQGGGGG